MSVPKLRVIKGSGGSSPQPSAGQLKEEKPHIPAQLVMDARCAVGTLTPLQLDVLRGLLRGCCNKQIARQLRISPQVIEIQRAGMMARLKAKSTADAVRIGIYAGVSLLDQ